MSGEFSDSVIVAGDNECWPYIGGSSGRYLHTRVTVGGRRDYAHRIAYRQAYGTIPEGLVVMHLCDYPPCCNARHLVAGTIAMNNAMRDQRNRRTPFLPRGTAHWSSKLQVTDVAAIRKARARGVTAADLAVMFAVSQATIRNVWSGRLSMAKWKSPLVANKSPHPRGSDLAFRGASS